MNFLTLISKQKSKAMNKKKQIIIINGANLNLLGVREKAIYGSQSWEEYFKTLKEKYPHVELSCFQSNIEGEIVNCLQEKGFSYEGIILNAGGYTHTSVVIADCVKALTTPVIEVHISNILKRETFRSTSLLAPACCGTIMGFGMKSYELALLAFLNK
jgi:3-dehydroquinate dehydratase II